MAAIRHQRDAAGMDNLEQTAGSGEVGMGDEDVVESCSGNPFDAVVDSAVQTEVGSPDDLCTALRCAHAATVSSSHAT